MSFLQKWLLANTIAMLTAVSITLPSNADINRRADYQFPYTNPYISTLTVRLMRPKAVKPVVIEIASLPGRENVRFGEGRQNTPVGVYAQPKAAPLVYLVSGVGGLATEGSTLWTAEFLASKGFSVITLPSPFNWRFLLGQSTTGVPGFTPEDASDLSRVAKKARAKAERELGLKVTRVAVAGYSLGAVDAAYLMKAERETPSLGIERAVMINPPVHIPYAVKVIDSLSAVGDRWPKQDRDMIWGYVYNVASQAVGRDIKDPYYFYGLDIVLKLSLAQTKYLIGSAFRQTLADTIFMSEEVAHAGLLKVPADNYHRTGRHDEAASITFETYMERAVWPYLSKKSGKDSTLEEFIGQADLLAIKDLLIQDPAFRMLHNDDDFLTRSEDLSMLAEGMGERAIIYPLGGHVGNLWHPRNLEDLYSMVKDLL